MTATKETMPEDIDQQQRHDVEESDDGREQAQEALEEKKVKDEDEGPSTWSMLIIFIALALALICVGLDRAIVATAVPKITVEFNSLDDVGWYGSSFLLTMCCFQLLFGKIYALVNVKWTFIAALAIFEIGSIVCAAAPSSPALIVGRAVAGIGAAGLLSGGLIIIAHAVPLDRRPKYTGALGGTVGISQIIAPTLGGVFTDKVTWRWCFWINLPLGGITVLVVLFLVRLPKAANKKPPTLREFIANYDLLGTLILMPWTICLLFALQWGGTTYPWGSWRIILLLVLFAVLFVAWVGVQVWQKDKATLPMRIVLTRTLASGMAYMFLGFAFYFLVIYYVPIWFQAVRDVSAYQSGINFLAASAATSVTVVSSGYLTSKTGYYVPQMIAGSVFSSVGAGLLIIFDRHTSTGLWVGTLIITGIGVGLGIQQPVVSAQTVFKGPDIALATSALMFSQSLASTVFLCVGQNLFSNQLVAQTRRLAPDLDDPRTAVDVGAADIHDFMERNYPDSLDGIIEAYNGAIRAAFILSLALACISIVPALGMPWVNVKKERQRELDAKKSAESSEAVVENVKDEAKV